MMAEPLLSCAGFKPDEATVDFNVLTAQAKRIRSGVRES